MTKIDWGVPRLRTYEVGVDRGVFYPETGPGVAWPGLISVEESYENQDLEEEYFEGRKVRNSVSAADFSATITSFSPPSEFYPYDGYVEIAKGLYASNQHRKKFGFCYRTLLGNGPEGNDYGYRLHMVYNAIAVPDGIEYLTTSDQVSPVVRRWKLNTIPYYKLEYTWFVTLDNGDVVQQKTIHRPTSHFIVDSRGMLPETLDYLEQVLYGTSSTEPELPTPVELIEIIR